MDKRLQPYSLTSLFILLIVGLLLSACQTYSKPEAPSDLSEASQLLLPAETSVESGRELYRTNCAFCHGNEGDHRAESLKDSVIFMDDAALAEIILNGLPEQGMPVLKKLTNEQIADLVALIRSWSSQ